MPPPHDLAAIDGALRTALDGLVEGATGDLSQPTPIRDARSGAVLRG
jgi:L-threonylcarbamoyladenylate synthase